MKRARSLLLLLMILIVLLCGLTAWSVYRERRQQRLNRDLIASVKRNDTKAVVAMLHQGADANCHDEPYKPLPWWQMLGDRLAGKRPKPSTAATPLMVALQWNDKRDANNNVVFPPENLPLVTALLDHKAEVNFRDGNEWTPLSFAIMGQKKSTVHLLLARGADMRADSRRDNAPLVNAMDAFFDSTDVLVDMLHRGADVNQRETLGDTALHEAIKVGNVEAVRLLLTYHPNLTFRGWQGYTPLSLAEAWPNPLIKSPIIHLLKQAGAMK